MMLLGNDPKAKTIWSAGAGPIVGLNCFGPFGFGYPFTAGGGNDATTFPDGRITAILNAGFTAVRFVVDPEALLTADSASNVVTTVLDARIAEVIAGIARRTGLGLKVICDVHFHGTSVSISSGWQYADVLDNGTKLTRLRFVEARLATSIAANCSASLVAMELFNEPPHASEISTASYITQIEAVWSDVRAAMPNHTIIVGGNALNALDSTADGQTSGLTAMTAADFDSNTAFSFHMYESPIFTLQATSGSIYQYMHNMTFPASDYPGGETAASAAFTAAAGGDSNAINACVTQTGWFSSIHQHFVAMGSKTLLAARVKVVTDWADAAGINRRRLFCTEYGCYFAGANEAPAASTSNFHKAIKDIVHGAGLGCLIVHQSSGDDFGIQDTTTPWAINPSIRTALGLI